MHGLCAGFEASHQQLTRMGIGVPGFSKAQAPMSAYQSPAVLVYRTKDKGTRRVQGYVCAVWEEVNP